MCRIGVFFRAAWRATQKEIVNQTVIAWNGTHLNHEHLKEIIQNSEPKNKGSKKGKTQKQISDEKAAAEMKRLAASISRGFQPRR